jgi:hypothetical protein
MCPAQGQSAAEPLRWLMGTRVLIPVLQPWISGTAHSLVSGRNYWRSCFLFLFSAKINLCVVSIWNLSIFHLRKPAQS